MAPGQGQDPVIFKLTQDPVAGVIDNASDIRLRAERRAGELLAGMEKNKGAIPGKTGTKGKPVLDDKPKLSDLGVTKTQSSGPLTTSCN